MPSTDHLRILHVEDNDGDAVLFARSLQEGGGTMMQVERVLTLTEARTLLDLRTFDLIVVDLSLADAKGVQAVARIGQNHGHCPLVVLTGNQDLVTAARAIHLGAEDVLFKGEQTHLDLVRALVLAVERNQARRGRTIRLDEVATDQGSGGARPQTA